MASEPAPTRKVGSSGRPQFASREPLVLVAVAALAGFAALALAVGRAPLRRVDEELFERLYAGDWLRPRGADGANEAVESILPLLNRAADPRAIAVGCALAALVLLVRGDRRGIVFLAVAVIPAAPASLALERVFTRTAPYPVEGSSSFPSGHAMLAMAAATAIALLLTEGRVRWLATVAGALFATGAGIAVIADGGHWPSDVIAGWLLAIAWVTGLCALMRHLGATGTTSSPSE